MTTKQTIRYVFNVAKEIEFAKSWVKYYAPNTPDDIIDKIFLSKYFVTKYTTAPSSKKTQEEIEKEAIEDLADYEAKIKKRICALKHLNKRDKILEKVMEELPSAHDLFHIMMSYRIYKTEDRTRIRRPSDLVISIAKVQENNGKNVDNMTKV